MKKIIIFALILLAAVLSVCVYEHVQSEAWWRAIEREALEHPVTVDGQVEAAKRMLN